MAKGKGKPTFKNKFDEQRARFSPEGRKMIDLRVAAATKYGWTGIRFWDWGEGLHIRDLVGFNTKGDFDFIPDYD